MEKKIFCLAKKRPICKVKVNLCCVYCKYLDECLKNKQNVVPCTDDDNQTCPFLV